MVLLSDGIENEHPNISQVSPILRDKLVRVNTIAMGPTADTQMELLSLQRGGKAYFVNDDPAQMSGALNFAFFDTTTTHLDSANSPIAVSL